MSKAISLAEVVSSDRLPTFPAVALRVIALVRRPEVDVRELADAIGADPALTARLLRTANSGYYGRVRGVTRLRDAVMVLGLRNVKTLALGFTLVSHLKTGRGSSFDQLGFWRRSLYTGVAARLVASAAGQPQVADQAFLAGVLHRVGMLVLSEVLGEPYRRLIDAPASSDRELLEREVGALGFNHCDVGGALGLRWNLPPSLVDAIAGYAAAEEADEQADSVRLLVAAGVDAANIIGGTDAPAAWERFRRLSGRAFGLSPEAAEGVISEAVAEGAMLEDTLDIAGARKLSPDEILARANQVLLDMNLRSARENARLELKNEELISAARTDILTGLPNRRHLDEYLQQQVQIAIRYETPLSALMIDIDHFKDVNDRHGHEVGDRALAELASMIRGAVRGADFVARYGGEEFAVVLPFTTLGDAAETAERVRREIADRVLVAGSVRLAATVSIGVAAVTVGTCDTPGALLRAADNALYIAKAAGRNRSACAEAEHAA